MSSEARAPSFFRNSGAKIYMVSHTQKAPRTTTSRNAQLITDMGHSGHIALTRADAGKPQLFENMSSVPGS